MRDDEVKCFTTNQPRTIQRSLHAGLLTMLDMLISCFIVAPLVIGFWRGTFEILNHYFFPGQMFLSSFLSAIIGFVGHTFFTIGHSFIASVIDPDRTRLTFYIISRFYTYIYALICVCLWRGVWVLTDLFTGTTDLWTVVLVTTVALLMLIGTRSVKNCCAPPFVIVTDSRDGYFRVNTMFKTLGSKEPGLYALDCIFTIIVVGILVVVVWRGCWIILDMILYPHDRIFSAWFSAILGYITSIACFATRKNISWMCDKCPEMYRIIVADAFVLISLFGILNVWRGVWMLVDIYFYPDARLLSVWLSHYLGYFLLVLLNCSNSLLVRGAEKDAEENCDCLAFPLEYIQLFFEKERATKYKSVADHQEGQTLLRDNQSSKNVRIISKMGNNLSTANNVSIS